MKNHDKIFRDELRPEKDIIVACLDSFRVESRNHLFHKDYINTWKRVEQIRKNTIFLYVALLGAVDITLITDNHVLKGILNVEYDRMFHILDSQTGRNFAFVLKGNEYSKMEKETRHQGLKFDKNGLITNTLKFKKSDFDHCEVEISRTNMPSEIWVTGSFEKKTTKIWPDS